jgi:hypothetical protein
MVLTKFLANKLVTTNHKDPLTQMKPLNKRLKLKERLMRLAALNIQETPVYRVGPLMRVAKQCQNIN